MIGKLAFTKLNAHPPGTIEELASGGFSEFFQYDPSREEPWWTEWRNYDRAIQERPEVAASGFVTRLEGTPVGMASWRPIVVHEIVRIGLNCVLPEYRGQGIGARQIREILRILRQRGVHTVKVTTGEHDFFKPARRMYKSCGFTETERREKEDEPGFRIVKYELRLNTDSQSR